MFSPTYTQPLFRYDGVMSIFVPVESINDNEILKNDGILEAGDIVVLSGGAQTFVNEKSEKKVMGGILRV